MCSIKQMLISAIQEEVKLTGLKQPGTLGTSAAEKDSESLLLPQNVDEIWLLKSSLCRSRLPHEAVALIRLKRLGKAEQQQDWEENLFPYRVWGRGKKWAM